MAVCRACFCLHRSSPLRGHDFHSLESARIELLSFCLIMSSGADVASDARVGGLWPIVCSLLTLPRQSLSTNLSRFAYKPDQKQRSDVQESNAPSSAPSRPSGMAYSPPAQSRDATNNSRFFPATPSNGMVLVPDSSPLTKDMNYHPYRPFQYSHDGSLISGASHHNNWTQSLKSHADPLSRPSGFVASTGVNNASITRRTPPPARRPLDLDGNFDDERPRKRANVDSPTGDPLNLFAPDSPLSPDIVRAGQKRKIVAAKPMILSSSMSSDESSPDMKAAVAGACTLRGRGALRALDSPDLRPCGGRVPKRAGLRTDVLRPGAHRDTQMPPTAYQQPH